MEADQPDFAAAVRKLDIAELSVLEGSLTQGVPYIADPAAVLAGSAGAVRSS